MPSPMQVFFFVVGTYFLVTGGTIYDIINEPPSIGTFFYYVSSFFKFFI